MKKPTPVSLTMVTALGLAANGQAPPTPDPCAAPSFNGPVCEIAIRTKGYCWQGSWVSLHYREDYPYFYNLYQQYLSAGATVDPIPAEQCHRTHVHYGGFGTVGAFHAAHS